MDQGTGQWTTVQNNGSWYRIVDQGTGQWTTVQNNGSRYRIVDHSTEQWIKVQDSGSRYRIADNTTGQWIMVKDIVQFSMFSNSTGQKFTSKTHLIDGWTGRWTHTGWTPVLYSKDAVYQNGRLRNEHMISLFQICYPSGSNLHVGWRHTLCSWRQTHTAVHRCTQLYIDAHRQTKLYTAVHRCTQLYINAHR